MVVGFGLLSFISCGSTKNLLPAPQVPITYNYYEYTIQNMDQIAKCDLTTLTAHYEGFDVIYSMQESTNQMTLTIENKTNKSLIIDKAKCYVLYNGYSKDLFKDVRTGRMTTYNNVQDAINNVQTNESSITLSIPPYSKWKLPLNETNIIQSKFPGDFLWEVGNHPLTSFTTNETIEFIIPYTFDYALAKWETSRNRLFVGNILVEKNLIQFPPAQELNGYFTEGYSQKGYFRARVTIEDCAEHNRIANMNLDRMKHNMRIYTRKNLLPF